MSANQVCVIYRAKDTDRTGKVEIVHGKYGNGWQVLDGLWDIVTRDEAGIVHASERWPLYDWRLVRR